MPIQTINSTDIVRTTGLSKINANFSDLDTTKQGILSEGAFTDGDKTKLDALDSSLYAKLAGGNTFTGNQTFDTNTFHIDTTNNRVGIGTTSPNAKLHIHQDGFAQHSSTSTSGSAIWNRFSNNTSKYAYGIRADGNFGINQGDYAGRYDHIVMTGTGNVGIGTTSPGAKLSISNSTTSEAIKVSNTGTGRVMNLETGTAGAQVYTNSVYTGTGHSSLFSIRMDNASSTGDVLRLQNDGSGNSIIVDGDFVVDGSGNVGIGTTSPGSKLSVVGLPTSATGLSAGDIWNDSGTLKIV